MKKLIGVAFVVFACTAFAQDQPRFGAYAGYNYVRFSSNTDVSAFSANGGSGQFVYKFNKWIGGVADIGAVTNSNQNGLHADTTITNFLFGPRVTPMGQRSRFQPYFQVLLGGVYAASSTQILGNGVTPVVPGAPFPVIPGQPVTARLAASQTGFAMTAGGGLDIRVTRHLSFRPIQLEYFKTRLQDLRILGDNNQNNIRYSAGLALWFGGEKKAPQAHRQVKTCPDGTTVAVDAPCPKRNFSVSLTASPTELCQGQTAHLTASFSGVSPTQLTFSSWTVNGKQVSQAGTFDFNSDGLAPGSYQVGLSTGGQALNTVSAETTVIVHEYRPPAGMVQANPAQIRAGEKSTISSNFEGQCGGPIRPATYQASEGAIQGDQFDSSSMQWDTSNNAEQRKTVTITATAADDRSTGTATTNIEVVRGAVVMPVRLPDLLFSADSSRVNNCAKRILLDQVRSYYERDSSGTVVLVGHSSSEERPASLAMQRAMNAAAVITAGTGVCLSIPQTQVQLSAPGADQNGVSYESGFCRNSVGPIGPYTDMRRVEVWFVPSGGQLPASVTNAQSAATLSVSSLGCPK